MQFRTAAAALVGLALPFSAVAAPAFAGDYDKGHKDPKVYIKKVDLDYGKYKKLEDVDVKVYYRCDRKKKDDYYKDDKKKYDDKGHLKVTLHQDYAEWSGYKKVKCTGYYEVVWVDLDKDKGHMKKGWAKVKAVLKDPYGDEAKDKKDVWIKAKDKYDDDHDDDEDDKEEDEKDDDYKY